MALFARGDIGAHEEFEFEMLEVYESIDSEDEPKKVEEDSDSSDDSYEEVVQNEENKEGETVVETVHIENTEMAAEQPKPRRKRFVPKYETDGVYKVILGEETQLAIEILVGSHVSGQFPWKFVPKNKILDHINSYGELSELYIVRDQIKAYPEEDIFMGYIADESNDADEFYICCTTEAKDHCKQQSDKYIHRQEKKLDKSVNKKPRPWLSYGSDVEIKSLIPIPSRPLMELEIKAKFPTVYQPEKFNVRDANSVRDGYIELIPYRQKFNNVFQRRIDCASQIAPIRCHRDAQTELRYPQNMWTQSIADALGNMEDPEGGGDGKGGDDDKENLDESDDDEEYEKADKILDIAAIEAYRLAMRKMRRPSYIKTINGFMSKTVPEMSDLIELNTVMDIYRDDYAKLQTHKSSTVYDSMKFEEYVCFTDIRAKDKCIASAVFHPMWSGIVAISYTDTSPTTLITGSSGIDPVNRAVYGLNPVLIWSHVDSLIPKLFLESPREVKSMDFCPFEENLLLGGCINGQLIIWDITNKLENVEKIEVLSETRERYRIAMQAHMGWMKNVHDPAVVQATALSNLMTSHCGSINSIKWLSPDRVVTLTGKLAKSEEGTKSLICITGSEDGHILIWNMSVANLNLYEGKKLKKSKRVLKRPSGLLVNVSPYKVLDRNLTPCFKIILGIAGHPETIPIESLGMTPAAVKYTYTPRNTGSGRKYYTSEVAPSNADKTKIIYVGSQYGELVRMSWEGHDFNTGEVVNSEYSDIAFTCTIHDGNITCVQKNPHIEDLIISVGGKIFAIWSDSLKGRPLIWKKRAARLTSVKWSLNKPSLFFIVTTNGELETWDILVRSDQPITVQTVSGNMLTYVSLHTISLPKNIVGVSDDHAAFQMFLCPPIFMLENPAYADRLKTMISNELKVMLTFIRWQENWIRNNPEILLEIQRKEAAQIVEKEEERRRLREEEEQRLEAEAEARRIARARVIGPEEKWQNIVQKLIEKTIAVKKRINRAQLIEQEKPLRELEAQRLEKERRMYEIMKNQQIIFNSTVAILFPEAIKKEAPPKKVFGENRETQKRSFVDNYELLKRQASMMIRENPYKAEFSWDATLAEGKERRQALNSHETFVGMHRCRLDAECFEGSNKIRSKVKKVTKEPHKEVKIDLDVPTAGV